MNPAPVGQPPEPAAEDCSAGNGPVGSEPVSPSVVAGTGPETGARAPATGAPPAVPGSALRRVRDEPVDLDPEDWAASADSGNERLLRERPPHW
jgi:hypothetical protein